MKLFQCSLLAATNLVSVIKANLSGWYFLIALLLLSVLFSGCDKEELAASEDCTTEVTAVNVVCGWGAFKSTWLKTNDGTYLQPWINDSGINTLVEGNKYRISYTSVVRDDRYDEISICYAVTPAADAVKLTCIRGNVSN